VAGEQTIASFGGFMTGRTGFVHRLIGGLSVIELSESPDVKQAMFEICAVDFCASPAADSSA
jgi:hypothetical protein